jgi:hypothetical protein
VRTIVEVIADNGYVWVMEEENQQKTWIILSGGFILLTVEWKDLASLYNNNVRFTQ